MSTLNGSDTQQNCVSISSGIASFGAGGPNPQWIPTLPYPLVINPAALFIPLPSGYSTSPAAYDAMLKVSDNTSNLTLTGVSVAQGYQDSLNLNNHASSNHIAGDFAVSGPAGLRVITVKGGSSNNVIAGVIHQHGISEDLKIGDWSDQSYGLSTSNDLSGLKMADGSPVTVVIGRATGTKLPGNCKILLWSSLGLKAYFWFKWAVRQIPPWRTPVGTVGPNWLP